MIHHVTIMSTSANTTKLGEDTAFSPFQQQLPLKFQVNMEEHQGQVCEILIKIQ